MNTLKHIHFVGIKGVGMTPLAIIAKEAGIRVTGSDVADEFITDSVLGKADITPLVGFEAAHITSDIDLVIATGAHGGQDNIEVKTAKNQGIEVLMKGEAVGKYMDGSILDRRFLGISVAGSHGKTTTSAMIATIFDTAGLSPSFLIGTSDILPLGVSGRLGNGEYFIAEADEYATDPLHNHMPQFLWQHPKYAVFTNIELDHPDIYPDVKAVEDAFEKFANNISSEGCLVVCGDDPYLKHIASSRRIITYGVSPENKYSLREVKVKDGKTHFKVFQNGVDLGEFTVSILGEHNALNSLAALIISREAGVSLEDISEGLLRFQGAKRRLEYIGKLASGTMLYDDYAHHPTEIKKSLAALAENFPGKHIICIFQPHTYSRTKKLLEDFSTSFEDADSVLLLPIYASLREGEDTTISSDVLAEKIREQGKQVRVLPGREEIASFLHDLKPGKGTIIVTMGAGDIYKLQNLLSLVH